MGPFLRSLRQINRTSWSRKVEWKGFSRRRILGTKTRIFILAEERKTNRDLGLAGYNGKQYKGVDSGYRGQGQAIYACKLNL